MEVVQPNVDPAVATRMMTVMPLRFRASIRGPMAGQPCGGWQPAGKRRSIGPRGPSLRPFHRLAILEHGAHNLACFSLHVD